MNFKSRIVTALKFNMSGEIHDNFGPKTNSLKRIPRKGQKIDQLIIFLWSRSQFPEKNACEKEMWKSTKILLKECKK